METAVVCRTIAVSCVSLTVLAIPAIAQCPDGTPPPCTRPSRSGASTPRMGVASLRVLASTPVAGTTLKWPDLEKGVPLHVVVEHAVQRIPPGQTPVLAAFVNLTPDATHAGQQRVLEARVITVRPTQRGLDWVLTTEHVRQQRITVQILVAFSSDTNPTTSPRGLRLSYDWAASITLEFPVADSSTASDAARQHEERSSLVSEDLASEGRNLWPWSRGILTAAREPFELPPSPESPGSRSGFTRPST